MECLGIIDGHLHVRTLVRDKGWVAPCFFAYAQNWNCGYPPLSGILSAALPILYFLGGRDRTMLRGSGSPRAAESCIARVAGRWRGTAVKAVAKKVPSACIADKLVHCLEPVRYSAPRFFGPCNRSLTRSSRLRTLPLRLRRRLSFSGSRRRDVLAGHTKCKAARSARPCWSSCERPPRARSRNPRL